MLSNANAAAANAVVAVAVARRSSSGVCEIGLLLPLLLLLVMNTSVSRWLKETRWRSRWLGERGAAGT